jgi:AAA+ ATPase superfamily predicted ATPase
MNCFDRDEETARLWRYFKSGRNVLMLAPRRMGKTVLLEWLKDESDANNFRAIVLDVEGYRPLIVDTATSYWPGSRAAFWVGDIGRSKLRSTRILTGRSG